MGPSRSVLLDTAAESPISGRNVIFQKVLKSLSRMSADGSLVLFSYELRLTFLLRRAASSVLCSWVNRGRSPSDQKSA
jgi:hypothetical protein